ncbi:hypothetical protein LQW54_000505 [Pestalotiopsis sp. IQ-011]
MAHKRTIQDAVCDDSRGIVYNDSNWDDLGLTISDIEHAVSLNVGLTNTGIKEDHLGSFKNAGGKIDCCRPVRSDRAVRVARVVSQPAG